MRATEFLNADTVPAVRQRASEFLGQPDAPHDPAPSENELRRTERPATAIRTRSGRVLLTEPEPYRDVWDVDVQGERRAPWTGTGGVMKSLPAQMVAGARSAVAELRRMMAEESITARRASPAVGETPAGAVTGRAAPGAIERQGARLTEDEDARAAAERDAATARHDLQMVTPHGMNTAQQAVSSLAQSAPPTLLGITAWIITRNPALAMAIAGGGGGAIQAGSTYGEARGKGASHRLSSTAATIDAVLEGVGEALPLRIALKQGSPVMARIYGTMAAEAGQEAATQALQDLNAYATYNPDITFNEAWQNLKVATLAGGMGGTVYGGVGAIAQNASRGAPPAAAPTARAFLDDGLLSPVFSEEGAPGPLTDSIQRLSDTMIRASRTPVPSLPPVAESAPSAAAFLDEGAPTMGEGVAAPSQAVAESTPATAPVSSPAATVNDAVPALAVTAPVEGASATAFLDEELASEADAEGTGVRAPVTAQAAVQPATSPVAIAAPTSAVVSESEQPSELSAGTGVVMTPPYQEVGGEVRDAAGARPDAIRQSIRTLFNVPINEGHFKQSRDTLGIFKVKPRTIRVRNQNDIGVISHETGHHFSETSRPVRDIMKTHAGELSKITPYAAQQKTVALQREEGFAEYLRLLWTQPTQAQERAPGFHAAFAQYVDKNGFRPAFKQIEGAIRDWQNLPPADRIMAKVGQAPERPNPKALRDRFIFEVLDKWLPLKRMVHDLKPGIAPSKDPFKAAHLLAGDGAIIESWIISNTIPFDPVRRADTKNYEKPLREILQPVAEQIHDFNAYLIARRADELTRHGKERLFTPEEIRAGLSLETPEFRKAAKEIYAFNDSLIDYAVEGGLLSPTIAGKLRQYSAYIPFFRESRDGNGHGGGKNPFKRLLGGTENLRDPIANLIQNTANIIHATNRNAVLVKARNLANAVRGGGRWIEDIPIPDAVLNVPTRSVLEALERQGVTLDQDSLQALQQIQRLVVPSPVDNRGERIVVVRVNGETKALQINNEMLWQALQSFEPADLGFIEQLLTIPADLLRSGITLSPEFMSRNFMRDTLSGFVQSKAGIFPVASTVSGFKEVATRSDAARLFRAFGGAYADMWKGDSQQTKAVLERMAKRGRFDPRTILTPGGILRLLNDLGSLTEAGTRVAEFKNTMKPGDTDSLIEAAYNAREVSVDFGMHGASQNIRLLTRITPFLNPAMQGLYKMARTSQERFMVTLLRGSMLTAFSVALFMLNRDEDWYDEIEQWERNVYWHINVGFKTDDGKVLPIRIPKPFEWGAVFGSVPESLAKVAVDQNGGEFAKRMKSIVTDVFSLRAVPTALLVPMEQWANRSLFTGRPIVSEGLEGLDPELQYTAGTSMAARETGNALGTSPARIDHAIRGLLGTMGVYVTSMADLVIRPLGDYPVKPSATVREMPVVRAFVHDPNSPNSRYVTEFYETLSKARKADASMRQLEGEQADAYYKKHGDVIDAAPILNRAARDMGAARREAREIGEDRTTSAEEKRREINERNQEIRRTARETMRDVISQGVR